MKMNRISPVLFMFRWLSQVQMAELFGKDTDTIGLHLKNVYTSGELDKAGTTEESSVVK